MTARSENFFPLGIRTATRPAAGGWYWRHVMRSWVSSFPYWGWAILFVAALKLHVPCGSFVHVGQCNCLRPLKFSCHARLMLMGHTAYRSASQAHGVGRVPHKH